MADIKVAMISSTMRDLQEHRSLVLNACLSLGVMPSMMENWPALDADGISSSLKKVDDADIYLGIFAHRYGFIPKDCEISITEMEYDRAAKRGIPRLIFIIDDEHPLKIRQVEIESTPLLNKFKDKLKERHVVSFFKSPEELAMRVTQSLTNEIKPFEVREPHVISLASVSAFDPHNHIFFVPYRSKGNQVVGRNSAIQSVRAQMLNGCRTAIGQTASFLGLGGLGKTQLAVEYAYLFRDQYPNGVIWLNADQDINSQLTFIAEKAKWVAPELEHKDKIAIARQRLRTHSHCLVIFDNLESIDVVKDLFPEPEAEPHILVTSRVEQPNFVPVPLELLDKELSLLLLKQESGRSQISENEETVAIEIAEKLGGLPLAIELAGAYLRHRPIDWIQYRDLLNKSLIAALPIKFLTGSFTQHESDLYSTLKINEELFTEEPFLREIFDILTWSGSATMSQTLLCALIDIQEPVKIASALSLGVKLRLLQKTPTVERYSLHRLIKEVRREHVSLGNRAAWVVEVSSRLASWFQALKRNFSDLQQFEADVEHLPAWQENVQMFDATLASRLMWLQAYPSFHRASYGDSFSWLQKSKELFESAKSEDLELKANLLTDLCTINVSLGKYIEAKKHIEEAITIRLKLFGEKHSETAMSFNNAAPTFINLNKPEKALEYALKAVEIWSSLHGENHINTALALGNVSYCYGALNNYPEGLKYAERALVIRERVVGLFHPDTAASYSSVGNVFTHLGEYARAIKCEEKALEIATKLFGNRSPLEATICNNICLAYLGLREFKKALASGLSSLAIRKHLFGDKHPETVISAINSAEAHLGLRQNHHAFQLLDYYYSKMSKDNPQYELLKHRRVRIVRPGFRQAR